MKQLMKPARRKAMLSAAGKDVIVAREKDNK